MKQQPIEELIKPYKITYLAKLIGVNYSTLQSQLNPNHPNRLTHEMEMRLRQNLTK